MVFKKEVFFDILFWIGLFLIAFAFFYNKFFIISLLFGLVFATFSLLEDLKLKFYSKKEFIAKNRALFLSFISLILFIIIIALIQESPNIKILRWKSSLFEIINLPLNINFSFYVLLGISSGLLILLIIFILFIRLRKNKLVGSIVKSEKKTLASLKHFIKKSLELNHKKRHIRKKAMQLGWPKRLFKIAYFEVKKEHTKKPKINKKNRNISLFLSTILLIAASIYILYYKNLIPIQIWLDILLETIKIIPQWIYLVILILIFLILIILIIKRFKKRGHKKIKTTHSIRMIKLFLSRKKSNETDFDILYKALRTFKKLTLSEIAQSFDIDEKKAEEWCKLLEDHKLAILHYPAIGEPELRTLDYAEVRK